MILLLIVGTVGFVLLVKWVKGYERCLFCGERKYYLVGSGGPYEESSAEYKYHCKHQIHDFNDIGRLIATTYEYIMFAVICLILLGVFIFIVLPILLWWPGD